VNKKILLVDDDIDFLNQIEIHLKNSGFDVAVSESEKDAEKLLPIFNPDLVITDLMIDNFDAGFLLAYKVKKFNPQIPVIIVTGVTHELGFKFYAGTQEERQWIKADAILNKPIRYEQLLKEIYTHLHLD
jgi:DNA-binding response OmpR family regulator